MQTPCNIIPAGTLCKKSKLARFIEGIIFIDLVVTSWIIRHDITTWWHHISIKNVWIALKLWRLSVAIAWKELWEFSWSRLWFTEKTLFMDVVYYYVIDVCVRYTANVMVSEIIYYKRERLPLLNVKFYIHMISKNTSFEMSKSLGTPPVLLPLMPRKNFSLHVAVYALHFWPKIAVLHQRLLESVLFESLLTSGCP